MGPALGENQLIFLFPRALREDRICQSHHLAVQELEIYLSNSSLTGSHFLTRFSLPPRGLFIASLDHIALIRIIWP